MLCNVVDRRQHIYKWKAVTVIFEPTCHDNTCVDADQAEPGPGDEGLGYEEFESITIYSAVESAQARDYWVTMYIYDLGEGIKCSDPATK